MRIEGKTVVFKTIDKLFDAEEKGIKPYTVRILENEAFNALRKENVERVQIRRVGVPYKIFERDITSIVVLGEVAGRLLVGIAWDPRTA